jgi:hypothetical protein
MATHRVPALQFPSQPSLNVESATQEQLAQIVTIQKQLKKVIAVRRAISVRYRRDLRRCGHRPSAGVSQNMASLQTILADLQKQMEASLESGAYFDPGTFRSTLFYLISLFER